jgi:hypothetical protein
MEFFTTADIRTTEQALRAALTIPSLPNYCASIERVLVTLGDRGRVYCVWGEFAVHRQDIRGGVRFTLPGCPNGLQWTLTTGFPPAPHAVVIHCTISRTEQDPDFVDSLRTFISHWREGLEQGWPARTPVYDPHG